SVSLPRLPISTVFPYTTLFRSSLLSDLDEEEKISKLLSAFFANQNGVKELGRVLSESGGASDQVSRIGLQMISTMSNRRQESERSEEHTSELQSRENLVCRLLL